MHRSSLGADSASGRPPVIAHSEQIRRGRPRRRLDAGQGLDAIKGGASTTHGSLAASPAPGPGSRERGRRIIGSTLASVLLARCERKQLCAFKVGGMEFNCRTASRPPRRCRREPRGSGYRSDGGVAGDRLQHFGIVVHREQYGFGHRLTAWGCATRASGCAVRGWKTQDITAGTALDCTRLRSPRTGVDPQPRSIPGEGQGRIVPVCLETRTMEYGCKSES